MTDLIHRAETASPDEQAHILALAWAEIHGRAHSPEWLRFSIMLSARAWLSAAECLVPVGCDWAVGPGEVQDMYEGGVETAVNWAYANALTPALALTAACLKANRAAAMDELVRLGQEMEGGE